MPGAGEMDMPAGIARPPLTFYSKPSSSSTLGPAHLCNETHVVGDVVGVTGGPKYCSLVLRTHRPRHWYVGWCPCRVSLPCSAHRTGDEAMAGGDERAIGCEPRRADGAVPTTPHTDYPVKLASRRARLLGPVNAGLKVLISPVEKCSLRRPGVGWFWLVWRGEEAGLASVLQAIALSSDVDRG